MSYITLKLPVNNVLLIKQALNLASLSVLEDARKKGDIAAGFERYEQMQMVRDFIISALSEYNKDHP
tara:strand:+ start:86 stop:286 length:201 start_codon:yes stop_codon:yes gene_type:complete